MATQRTPKITESIIRAGADPQSFQRGRELSDRGAISNASVQGSVLAGDCEGNMAPYYRVRAELDEAGIREAYCTCPYDWGGYCKHVAALLLTYLHHPKRFAVRREPSELLADLSHEDLHALVTKLLRDQPELYDRVEAALAVPSTTRKGGKRKRKAVDVDVYRRQITAVMHSLDRMRMSEAYWHVGGLVEGLREVESSAMKFLDASDADTALAILLTLLEEASRGIEFIDDSNGELGGFVGSLGLPLAEAILSLDWSAVERTKLADQLTKLVNYAGEYGMEGDLDLAIQAAQSGWEAPASDAETSEDIEPDERWLQPTRLAYGWADEEFYEGQEWGWGPSPFGDLTEAKLNVLERQGRTDEYLALCLQADRHLRYALKLCDLKRVPEALKHAKKHLASAEEALQLAERLRSSRHIPEAIEIGERGLSLEGPKAGLGEWLGPVEEAQGRDKEALKAWLAAFPEHPSLHTYKTLKRLAASGWKKMRPEVMTMLRKSRDAQTLAEVLLFEEEWDEAIKVAERRDVWYPVVETVADAVLPHRPEWVARISVKHAERLMVEPKSKNYPIAAEWLKRAKKAYTKLGQTSEWHEYLEKITEKYKRRPALQGHLRRL